MQMAHDEVLPPGQHPFDSSKEGIDPVGFALERIQTFLFWISEHRASFEKERNSDPNSAENELRCLENSTEQALIHLQRLKELLFAGFAIDPNKQLPKGLVDPQSENMIAAILARHLQP
jgi:hypothetical protein